MREGVLDKQTQLSLPVSLPDGETFTSFYVGQNGLMIDALQKVLSDEVFHCFYLWSSVCAGKSHLLYAACAELDSKGKQVAYIPLEQHVNFTPAILEGLDTFSLVCLDNIEKIAGNREWEVAIFNLYNNLFEFHGILLIAANALPKQLPFILPDLASRLDWGQIYRMEPLSDVDKLQALQLRAKLRGFDLPDDVGNFLLKRLSRDMRTLFTVLDKLDSASIVAQRKMTIPFVKDSLDL